MTLMVCCGEVGLLRKTDGAKCVNVGECKACGSLGVNYVTNNQHFIKKGVSLCQVLC